MRRMRRPLALLVVGALALAACGGDDDGDATSEPTEADTTDDTEADGDSDDGDSADGDSGGPTDFEALIEQGREANFKVTYESRTDGDVDSVLTFYQLDGQVRLDTDETSAIIETADGAVTCDGIDTDSPTCTQVPVLGEFLDTALLGFFGAWSVLWNEGLADMSGLVDVEEGTEEIAGRDARCATIDVSDFATDEAGEATSCVDAETGVLLRYAATSSDGGTSEIVATEFGEPSESDFEPPADVEEIPLPEGLEDLEDFDPENFDPENFDPEDFLGGN